ncbi:MAG: transglycosylase SLT domain-containing protein [Desulfarculaceae bacterium]|nr:transglycosylase SLT domain-containing protein [Desulfarculaceae bacterium]
MIRYFTKGIISLLFFVIVGSSPSFSNNHDTTKNPDTRADSNVAVNLPSLVDAVRFPDAVTLCGVRVPLEIQDVRERLEKEMLLALWDRAQVILWLKRSSKYFPHMEKIIREKNVPPDIKYMAVVESALRPHVRSHRGAVGFWQFLRSTGKRYGLRIDARIDERRNLFRSTKAACDFLTNLHDRFDSWLLAMAAYNMGGYSLSKKIDRQKTDDFFTLYLPAQTQQYIFKIIAAKLIMENPAKYGFAFEENDYYEPFSFDRVNITSSRQIPVTLVSEAAGIPFKQVKDMNPEIRGDYLSKGENTVLIPDGRAEGFKERFASLYGEWEKNNSGKVHMVKRGENLSLIAKKYQVSLSALLRMNNLSRRTVIHPGDRLIIQAP